MKRSFHTTHLLPVLVLGAALALSLPASAQSTSFVKARSHESFPVTVNALKEAVSSNHMMVMGHINQARVLSMTGLNLKGAESFFVGNPHVGKMAFGMNPAAGAVLPARIYVWVNHGITYVGYFKPSSLLTQVSPGFSKMAGMLNKKFAMITRAATR